MKKMETRVKPELKWWMVDVDVTRRGQGKGEGGRRGGRETPRGRSETNQQQEQQHWF